MIIIIFTIGWFRLKKNKHKDCDKKVSVIIPARNENQTIGSLLTDLKNQSISDNKFEVIVIDDHSDDSTAEIVSDFSRNNP